MLDSARLETILRDLPEDDAAFLRRLLPQPARTDRLALRDDALRDLARDHYADLPSARSRSAAIACDLDRLQSIAARASGESDGNPRRRELLRVLRLNGGQSLGARQIRTIITGAARTPVGNSGP